VAKSTVHEENRGKQKKISERDPFMEDVTGGAIREMWTEIKPSGEVGALEVIIERRTQDGKMDHECSRRREFYDRRSGERTRGTLTRKKA